MINILIAVALVLTPTCKTPKPDIYSDEVVIESCLDPADFPRHVPMPTGKDNESRDVWKYTVNKRV